MDNNALVNQIISEARETIKDENFIYKAVLELNKHFLFIRPVKKNIELIDNFNKSIGCNSGIITDVQPTLASTVEDLLLRGLVMDIDNPFEFIKQKIIVVPKHSGVMEYVEGLKLIDMLTDEKSSYFENTLRLFSNDVALRINRQFLKNFCSIFPGFKDYSKSYNWYSPHHKLNVVSLSIPFFTNIEINKDDSYTIGSTIAKKVFVELNDVVNAFKISNLERRSGVSLHDTNYDEEIERKERDNWLQVSKYIDWKRVPKELKDYSIYEGKAPVLDIGIRMNADDYYAIAFGTFKQRKSPY